MALRLQSVEKQVGSETHIHPLDLTLSPGINVLLGATRAGKTSLMRLMAGLDQPTAGRVFENERDVTGVPVRERNLAMVYQQFINYPSLTVFENIASPLKIAGKVGKDEVRARVEAVAKKLRIDHLLHRLPGELSGGQQQRTALARALIKQSGLLLLDEPLVNLDYKLREELRLEMRSLFTGSEATVVYATTEPIEALLLGGYTAVLDEGRLLQYGPTLEVFHHPASIRVAEVFNDPPMNFFSAEVTGLAARVSSDVSFDLDQHLAKLPQGTVRLGVRAGHVRLGAQATRGCVIPAEVELAEISGSETFVHARHGNIVLVAQLPGVHALNLGQMVQASIDNADLFAFNAAGKLLAAPRRNAAGAGS